MVEYCLIHPEIHFVYQQDNKPTEQWNYQALEVNNPFQLEK
jgi:hypothetical protein